LEIDKKREKKKIFDEGPVRLTSKRKNPLRCGAEEGLAGYRSHFDSRF